MSTPLFHIGDIVQIDEKDSAYIVEANVNGTTISYKVCYHVGNHTENAVEQSRCRAATLLGSTGNRSGTNRHFTASSNIQRRLPLNNTTIRTPTITPYNRLKQAIIATRKWRTTPQQPSLPLYDFLQENESKPHGWLRQTLPFKNEKKQLNEQEHMLLLVMTSLFTTNSSFSGHEKGWTTLLANAWNVDRKVIQLKIDNYVKNDFSCKRKERSDKGATIFTCEKKRAATFTPLNEFKKAKHLEFRESTGRLDHPQLKQQYNQLPQNEKQFYENEATINIQRSATLWDELKDLLLKTKGKISFTAMANHLRIVSTSTIFRHLHLQEGFTMRKDRVLPHLDAAAKLRRVVWACQFWLFWKSVRAIPPSKVKVVLIHMDEKWFYAVRARSNCKVLESIGLESNDYYSQHKNHIGKELYIVATAFVLNNNDITAGGKAIPIACVRVGKKVKATKDSFKRVYKEDGSFHYPKILSNQLRRKDEMYFTSIELTGSSEGTSEEPKVSLLKQYQDIIIPAIEEKVVERFNEEGNVKVCIVKQEDGAGLHTDKTYQTQMKREFGDREWLLFDQPSQSPVTNVHDACIFPMMSKKVSSEQAMMFGSTLLKGEQLNQTVNKVWNDEDNIVAMSRAFAGHHQIVCSILHHNGDNSYLSKKGGLTFGIRKTFVRDHEGEGVISVPLAAQEEGETAEAIIRNSLKFQEPKLEELPQIPKLSNEMTAFFIEHMNIDLMDEELLDAWAVEMFGFAGDDNE